MTPSSRILALLACATLVACASTPPPANSSGKGVQEVAVGSRGPVEGVGVGGRDIAAMTNQMARDILSSKGVMGDGAQAPRVIIDSQYFRIDGSQPMNRNLISQRLLVELNRAAAGRLMFVGRRHAGMVAAERDLKRDGVTDSGSKPMSKAQLGADYRLAGTFSTLDTVQAKSGMQQRYSQFVFELVDVESSNIVWTGIYEVERAGADDVVYR